MPACACTGSRPFKHPTKPGRVTVPHPTKDIPVRVLRSIYRQAGLNWKERRCDTFPVIEPMEPGEFLAAVDVNLDRLALSDKTQRLNVTIPERALALIDVAAKRAGESRSRFLTQAVLARIERD